MFWSKEDVQSDQISSLEFSAQMNLKQGQRNLKNYSQIKKNSTLELI